MKMIRGCLHVVLTFLISYAALSKSSTIFDGKFPSVESPPQRNEKVSTLVSDCDNEDNSEIKLMLKVLQTTNEMILLKLYLMEQNMKTLQSTLEKREEQISKLLEVDPAKQFSEELKKQILDDLVMALEIKNQGSFKTHETSISNKIDTVHNDLLKAISNQTNATLQTVTNVSKTETALIQNALEKQEKLIKVATKIHVLPSNCAESFEGMPLFLNGIYRLNASGTIFEAYCMRDRTDPETAAWTVIQRRINGDVGFYRNWTDYKIGFGNLKGDFWLGLDNIHAMTSERNYELLIELEDWENEKRFAKYDKFRVEDETQKYYLSELGTYSGTAGDSFSYHAHQKFSTKDADNDSQKDRRCAKSFIGAWWYSDCHESNLNGFHSLNKYGKGINWEAWHGSEYSLKFVQMAIRPRKL